MGGFHCPSCGELVHLEELVEGRCPLCREECVPEEESMDLSSPWEKERWLISLRAKEGLRAIGLNNAGAENLARRLLEEVDPSSLKRHENVFRKFRWSIDPDLRDYFRYKTCTFCGRKHVLVGGKVLEGYIKVEPGEGDVLLDASIHWVCRRCGSRTPRSALR